MSWAEDETLATAGHVEAGPPDEPPEEAVAALREAVEDDEPLVRGHAAWAVDRSSVGR